MQRIPMVAALRQLHDSPVTPRPARETAADRISIVTALVRANNGWDDQEARPELERVVRITPLRCAVDGGWHDGAAVDGLG